MANITDVTSRRNLDRELRREQKKENKKAMVASVIRALIAVVAVAAIISTLFLPVLRIDGNSMSETLHDGDIAIVAKGSGYATGDIVAFYHNNDILIKRVIASAGQWVDIADDGTVYVDGQELDEPYVTNLARGECTMEFPYQVPEGRLFVMGDHRNTSIDSRSTQIGPVRQDLIIGKLILRVWPIGGLGNLNS